MCAAIKANWNQPAQILDLRHFSSSDLRPLLEEENRVWNQELYWDYSQSAEMILRYVDARILPGYVAVDRGRVNGYAFFVYEGAKGVIGDLFVRGGGWRADDAGENPVEGELLRNVIETLQRSPGVHRIEAQMLLHRTGALAAPFLEQKFRQHRRLFMTLQLNRADAAEMQSQKAPEGIQLRPWVDSDYQQAAAIITTSYRGHIDSEINDQYRTSAGSLRFLNNIVRFPGCGIFDAQSSFLAVHKQTRAAVGLILCSQVKEQVGHITQVCVLPGFRGRGIGEALLAANSAQLRRRGFTMLSLTVTEANRGAVELYHRLGYVLEKIFDAFVWEG